MPNTAKGFVTMSMLRISAFAITTCLLVAAPGTALGQAWVPVKNSLSASLDYTFGPSDRIIESEGFDPIDAPGLANHTVAIGAEYTPPIKNLAVSVTVPIVTTRYAPENDGDLPRHGRYDDGNFHSVLQDLRTVVRYQVLPNSIVALAPHVGVSVPMTDYETLGFAGAGRGLKQLHLGVGVGRYFTDGPLQNFYVHALFEYSKVERYKTAFIETEQYNQDRIDVKGIIGYFIMDQLEVNLGVDWRYSLGGLYFKDLFPNPDDPDHVVAPDWVNQHHDPLLAEGFLLLGGGVTYEVIEGFRFNAVFRYWATGQNTRDTHVIGAGFSWDIM